MYRVPMVCLSLVMAASARSSAPNSTKASPFGRPLAPSTWLGLGLGLGSGLG